jgi:cation diffusion facilitator CzcD-associated flavoprotein CzcO
MKERATSTRVAIIGAGAAGLCMAIRLRMAGLDEFVLFEKSDQVGGTWYDNHYPGAGCDVHSHLYCFSFEKNPAWSRKFSLQPEILRYFRHCAEKWRITERVLFGTEIASARFDEGSGRWHLETTHGERYVADVVVSGTGQLNLPAVPRFPGAESFEGEAFHSARWRDDVDLDGRDVVVVGTGASAVQIVPPLAKRARKLTVLQRSPSYVIRRGDRAYTQLERWIFERVPFALWLYRALIYLSLEARFMALHQDSLMNDVFRWMALSYLDTVRDPVLRKKLEPDYAPGCKRILISDDYYEALSQENVEVVTSAVERIEPHAVRTADGEEHPADVIVYATGFRSTSFLAPIEIVGRDGVKLSEVWRSGAEAYWGIAVPGFPNLFMLYGPNTNLGHNSILFMIECQVHWVLRCLARMRADGARTVEVSPWAMREHNERLQRDLARTAWAAGCHNWYKTDDGKIVNNWSGWTLSYWLATREPRWGELTIR